MHGDMLEKTMARNLKFPGVREKMGVGANLQT
jgi:hypothetical protein